MKKSKKKICFTWDCLESKSEISFAEFVRGVEQHTNASVECVHS